MAPKNFSPVGFLSKWLYLPTIKAKSCSLSAWISLYIILTSVQYFNFLCNIIVWLSFIYELTITTLLM